eukprot:s70_g16.t1
MSISVESSLEKVTGGPPWVTERRPWASATRRPTAFAHAAESARTICRTRSALPVGIRLPRSDPTSGPRSRSADAPRALAACATSSTSHAASRTGSARVVLHRPRRRLPRRTEQSDPT